MTAPERLLLTDEAADLLRVKPQTLRRWRVSGGGPTFRKVGSRALYSPEDLRAFVEAGKRISTSRAAA